MPHSWNLSRWMDVLGQRRRDQPELIYAVQPVSIVGDYSAHAAPLLPPTAWVGSTAPAIVGEYSALQLISRAPGGTYVRNLSGSGAGRHRFRITAAPVTLNNVVAGALPMQMGEDDTPSVAQLGSFAVVIPSTTPSIRQTNTTSWQVVDVAYLPTGWCLEVCFTTANTSCEYNVLYEDCMAQPSER